MFSAEDLLLEMAHWKKKIQVHCKYPQACIDLEMEAMMRLNNILDLRVYASFCVLCEYFIRACTSPLLNSTSEPEENGEEFALYM